MDIKEINAKKVKAEEFFSGGNYAQALLGFEELREVAENHPKIYLRIGDTLQKLGERERVIEEYRLAAWAFTRHGCIVSALAACKVVLAIDPTLEDIEGELVNLYMGLTSAVDGPKRVSLSFQSQTNESVDGPSASGPFAEKRTRPEIKTFAGSDSDQMDNALCDVAFPRTPLFSDLPHDELLSLISRTSHINRKKGDFVFSHGDVGDSIYVLASGTAEVVSRAKDGEEVVCATLNEADFFGEFGFFSDTIRSAGVRAVTDIELLELPSKKLKSLSTFYENVYKVLFGFYKERVLDRLLAISDIFRGLSHDDRQWIMERVWVESFEAGSEILKEGDEGDKMYFIKSGKVDLWTCGEDGSKSSIVELSAADSFGQYALILDTRRTATATALCGTELVVISRPLLKDIIARYPAMGREMEEVVKKQLAGTERLSERMPKELI